MFVYLENAHNISSYKPVFQYNGDNIDDLVMKIKGYLEVQIRGFASLCMIGDSAALLAVYLGIYIMCAKMFMLFSK
jgi:hypothetical protein